jgi:hypothetical protein
MVGNPDGGEDNRKLFTMTPNLSLGGDLGRQLASWQTKPGENGQFLAAHQRIQPINGRDTSLNKLRGMVARPGVNGLTIDIKAQLGDNRRTTINRLTGAVEHATQHLQRNPKFDNLTAETRGCPVQIQATCTNKYLDHCPTSIYFQDLPASNLTVGTSQLHNLVIANIVYILHKKE